MMYYAVSSAETADEMRRTYHWLLGNRPGTDFGQRVWAQGRRKEGPRFLPVLHPGNIAVIKSRLILEAVSCVESTGQLISAGISVRETGSSLLEDSLQMGLAGVLRNDVDHSRLTSSIFVDLGNIFVVDLECTVYIDQSVSSIEWRELS